MLTHFFACLWFVSGCPLSRPVHAALNISIVEEHDDSISTEHEDEHAPDISHHPSQPSHYDLCELGSWAMENGRNLGNYFMLKIK